jgi:hypothetical protein
VLTSLIGLSLAAIYAMPSVSPANLFLAFLSAGLMAAPLLERARYLGLSLAIIAGSVAFIYAIAWLPTSLSPSVLLLVAAITATLVGMVGGMLMPLHPARHVEGKALWRLSPQAPMLLGWLALAAALALAMVSSGAVLDRLHATAMLTSALVAVLFSYAGRGEDLLQQLGEAVMAGLLISLSVSGDAWLGSVLGVAAGCLVTRSEAIALSLRMDDPHHLTGAVLAPALLGLIMPGLFDMAALAQPLTVLGGSLLYAGALALLLWPAAMFLFGLRLPPRMMREGTTAHP